MVQFHSSDHSSDHSPDHSSEHRFHLLIRDASYHLYCNSSYNASRYLFRHLIGRSILPKVLSCSLIGLCAACGVSPQRLATESVQAAPVNAVVALGRLAPEGDVIKLSAPNARDSQVERLLVKEGEIVQANQVLAILKGADRRAAELRDAQADVELREAELQKLQQGEAKSAQLLAQQAAIQRLKAQLQTSIQQRQAAVTGAEVTLANARLTVERRQSLQRAGAISQADLDTAQREFATAAATLAERQADLQQARATLTADIAQEEARLRALQEVRPVDVHLSQIQIEKAKIVVEQRRASLGDMQIRAPIAGQILRINARVGEEVSTGQGIMELAKTDQMTAIAEVSESDIGKVRKGQRAIITSEYGGFRGDVGGTVEQIGLRIGRKQQQDAAAAAGGAGGNPTTDQNARIIAVKVRIDPKDNAKVAAFTDMQVRVKLDVPPHSPESQDSQPNSTVEIAWQRF
jgi:HlyD family secretion protein